MNAIPLVALLATAPAADAGQPPLRVPGPAIQLLMLGTWDLDISYASTPTRPHGGKARGSETWRPGPDGRSLIEEYAEEGDAGVFQGIALAWWDAAARGQRFVWCGTGEPSGCYVSKSVARWVGNELVWAEDFTVHGRRVRREEVFRDITPNGFVQLLREGPVEGAVTTVVTIRATRRVEAGAAREPH